MEEVQTVNVSKCMWHAIVRISYKWMSQEHVPYFTLYWKQTLYSELSLTKENDGKGLTLLQLCLELLYLFITEDVLPYESSRLLYKVPQNNWA